MFELLAQPLGLLYHHMGTSRDLILNSWLSFVPMVEEHLMAPIQDMLIFMFHAKLVKFCLYRRISKFTVQINGRRINKLQARRTETYLSP